MLTPFDWLRRCRTGVELIGTLQFLAEEGPPVEWPGPCFSALDGPCRRCWICPRVEGGEYCVCCDKILSHGATMARHVRFSVVIWADVNNLSQWSFGDRVPFLGVYVHGRGQFLLLMDRHNLQPWLQSLVLEYGTALSGLLRFFPTMGSGARIGMGDILTRAIHTPDPVPKDRLEVHFYAAAHEVIRPQVRRRKEALHFTVVDFLGLLEMAEVFRAILNPEQQQELKRLLTQDRPAEQAFYWGRFVGALNQQARDMLDGWSIRNWPLPKIRVLYELLDYVAPPNFT